VEVDGQLVGMCWTQLSEQVVTVLGLVICPEKRGLGIGSSVLLMLDALYAPQANWIELQVHVSNHAPVACTSGSVTGSSTTARMTASCTCGKPCASKTLILAVKNAAFLLPQVREVFKWLTRFWGSLICWMTVRNFLLSLASIPEHTFASDAILGWLDLSQPRTALIWN
jgi:hypothetical protein